ncbi:MULTISPECIES: pentapeptide repeat-containing protein [unclassified Coleofasciculus]|uniref:pentapeptide repeat-containing protein n=1 Tax=unclassified Coleofasciculus TaxID=2692782 RepID=UPI00188243C5|nr:MULTISPECIES: pentapeptide repeat-containing protein [unclassified Coleofasciculus]MBE9128895.1 pentapeptide repeat-containing protein [Coleofasciculus sp. LEGE 07081]MBE9151664.1 pentapeptide repeat-containing protein [Coleofasciculus sp. LEGE 07092]
MAGELEIKVKKPVSVFRKEIKVNLKGLFASLGKAAINGAFLKWDDLAESGVEVLENLGLEAKSGEIAGLLIVRSLIQAIQDLLKEHRELLVKKPDNLKELYNQLNCALASDELIIDPDFFQRPKELPIVQAAKSGLAQWLEAYVEKKVEAEKISDRLPAYFVFALNNQWVEHSQDYIALKEVLDTPFTQATKREQGWLRYRALLQKRVDEPIFWEAFSLKQVYVPLRAYYEREVAGQSEKKLERGITEGKDYERVIVDLNSELETWLQDAESDDAIRLISGGPGSGKSSFAKIFAAQQAEKGEIPVLFIPLHLFKLSDDLVKAVGEFVQVEGFLSHNPLDRENGESRLLIIFDGLDELSMQGKVAEQTAKDFVEEVRREVDRFNYHQLRLQVLITGREVVVQANRSKFRKSRQLLYILPYFVTEAQRKSETNKYIDEQNLLEADQRQLWWQFYGQAKGKEYSGLPPELDKDNLIEITAQPLLNYLVALSIERNKLQFSEETNLNEIYADLLDAVYERGYEGKDRQHRAIEEINKNEFIRILEEIALACWHGDGRTTTVREIENHCKKGGLKRILDRFQESLQENSRASITRLLTAFYFRESGGIREDEKTFEFTHKSFGEYLTAKRIVRGVKFIHKKLKNSEEDLDESWGKSDALVTWATLCGLSAMDEYLFHFVCDEMRLQDLSDVRDWQKTLCRLIEFMLRHGMPMEGLNPRPNFQEENRQARNAEEALLAVLNSCARLTEKCSEIKWHSLDAFGIWIFRLQGQRVNSLFCLNCLSFLDLQCCSLGCQYLCTANLSGANLSGANLQEANLSGANLSGAILQGVNLYGAKLQGMHLEGANLSGANLEEANLQGMHLEGANLQRADLGEANLQWAKLRGANLEWAYLYGANLYRANLSGANLKEANLQGANLEWANLEGANLRKANLEQANLQGTILEGKDIKSFT